MSTSRAACSNRSFETGEEGAPGPKGEEEGAGDRLKKDMANLLLFARATSASLFVSKACSE